MMTLQTIYEVINMDRVLMKRLNKQGLIFAAVHTVFFLNLAFEFIVSS
jgi:hypothetical protein